MPRPIRIQYEHAFYHVMNRGQDRKPIFHNDEYRHAFLKTLDEAYQRFDARIHAYCLMDNHYHLLIETPRANLDRIMRHINGIYTQRYNRLKQTDGPLFRGRYKAILVDRDAYLLQLSRYIHRNPAEVRGAPPDMLSTYRWSSYLAYVNKVKPPHWLSREPTYRMLGHRQRYGGYRAYVEAGNDEALQEFYDKAKLPAVLGDQCFREAVAEKEETILTSLQLSSALSERPAPAAIVKAVAQVFELPEAAILERKRGRQTSNTPRKVAMYCCQRFGDMDLKGIAAFFGLTHTGSASSAVTAIRKQLDNGTWDAQIDQVARILNIIKEA